MLDETVPLRIILRLADCSEDGLRSDLQRLHITLVATVSNPNEAGLEDSAPSKEIIFSGTADEEDPLVIVNSFEGDRGDRNHAYVIWTIHATLSELRSTNRPFRDF
jgi:hypothetical protein